MLVNFAENKGFRSSSWKRRFWFLLLIWALENPMITLMLLKQEPLALTSRKTKLKILYRLDKIISW